MDNNQTLSWKLTNSNYFDLGEESLSFKTSTFQMKRPVAEHTLYREVKAVSIASCCQARATEIKSVSAKT